MDENALRRVRDAGVVGAGGAGFPTHVKLASSAEVVIANGAECEPLLECDRHLMLRCPDEVVAGLRTVCGMVGAKRGYLALKEKHTDLIPMFTRLLAVEPGLEVAVLPDVYPMGDEQVLVHQVTGRLVPPGGLPLAVGCVVSNVTTMVNVLRAQAGTPVTRRLVTVAGLVKRPVTLDVAIGTRVGDLIDRAGGLSVPDAVLISGGPMTGRILDDLDAPVTKAMGGVLALQADSQIVLEKRQSVDVIKLQSRAACFQCRDCTRVCPRWQLGFPFQPHLVMRAANYAVEEATEVLKSAHYCCDCGLCSLIGCQTMKLSPRRMCTHLKGVVERPAPWKGEVQPPAISLEDQQVPSSRIKMRHRLGGFGHTVFDERPVIPARVTVLLKQGVGAPATPVVVQGARVSVGQLLGSAPEKGVGAAVHASIEGVVVAVTKEAVTVAA